MEVKNEITFSSNTSFLDDNIFCHEERKFGSIWKNETFLVDRSAAHFSGQDAHAISDYGFEGSYLRNTRDAKRDEQIKFEWHPPNLRSFMMDCYPGSTEAWAFAGINDQHSWSNMGMEDSTDNLSLLSEESCSSTAVRDDHTASVSKLMKLKSSCKNHSNELRRNSKKKFDMNSLHKKQGDIDFGEIYPQGNLKGSGSIKTMPSFSRSKSDYYLKELHADHRNSKPLGSSLLEGKDIEYLSEEDIFSPFPVSEFYSNLESSRKRSRFDVSINLNLVNEESDCTYSDNYFSKMDDQGDAVGHVHPHDFDILSNIRPTWGKLSVNATSQRKNQAPYMFCLAEFERDIDIFDLSQQHIANQVAGDESDLQPSESRETLEQPGSEASVLNNDLPSENHRITDSKNNSIEYRQTKAETPELIKSPNARDSPEHVETSFASKEIPAMLDSCINKNQFLLEAHFPVQTQNRTPFMSCLTGFERDIETLDLSQLHTANQVTGGELDLQPNASRETLEQLGNEASVLNNDLSSVNHHMADSKSNSSECRQTKDETPELIDSPQSRASPKHMEISLSSKEIPAKLESCIHD